MTLMEQPGLGGTSGCRLLSWLCAGGLAACLVLPLPAAKPVGLYREGRILIKPAAGARAGALAGLHAAHGVRVIRHFKHLGDIQVLELAKGARLQEALRRYEQSGLVQYAEPDCWAFPALTPDDPSFLDGILWHLENTGQNGGLPGADIHAPGGWDAQSTASNVIVALVDTGVRCTHEDLAANLWVNPGEIPGNGMDDDGDGIIDDVHGINAANESGDPIDLDGHGTAVAGILAAVGNNGMGGVGVAWRVRIMACRYTDDSGNGAISDVLECFNYARQKGAHIINASFVVPTWSPSLNDAVGECQGAGIIVVAAAGNSANDSDVYPYFPAGYNWENIVAVAATTRTDELAAFSNFGATSVDLAAPGSEIYTTGSGSDSAYGWVSGTSFATPMVAGALALLRAHYPPVNYRHLINSLYAGVDPLPGLAGKCVTAGRLNLAHALAPRVIADFSPSATTGAVPFAVNFTDASCCGVTHWWWDFGDGATSREQSPSHTFDRAGNFTVTLSVADQAGRTNSISRLIFAVANYQVTQGEYNWIDPAGLTPLMLFNGLSFPQTLPFAFRFYDSDYSQLYVSANGFIGFDYASFALTATNTDLADPGKPNNLICPFWDELAPNAGGNVYLGTTGTAPNRKVVISWVSVPRPEDPTLGFTFQAWLEEGTQRIQFQYQEVQPDSPSAGAAGRSATVGVENASGTVAAKYSRNGSRLLTNNQAILFLPAVSSLSIVPASDFAALGGPGGPFTPDRQVYAITNTGVGPVNWAVSKSQDWVSLSATSGSLSEGASTNITVSFNASADALPAGGYTDTLGFTNATTGAVSATRRVTLTVVAPPVIAVQPQSQIVNLGSNATFSVEAAGSPPPAYRWLFNGHPVAAWATNSTLTITNAQDDSAGNYSVVVDNGVPVTSSNALLTINHLPVPALPTLQRYWGSGFKIQETFLLGTDPDGDLLALYSIDALSSQGAAVSVAQGWICYTPSPGLTNDDAFAYVVSDGRGGLSPGAATVVVLTNTGPSLNLSWTNASGGSVRVVGSGIPHRSYTVEFCERLVPPDWQVLGTVMADTFGVFEYVDHPPPGATNHFYRVTTD